MKKVGRGQGCHTAQFIQVEGNRRPLHNEKYERKEKKRLNKLQGAAKAKAFAEVANVTGIVLTKLDGTAKGGIVYSIQRELGIPVKLVGVGEGIKDFAFFDAKEFASGLVG